LRDSSSFNNFKQPHSLFRDKILIEKVKKSKGGRWMLYIESIILFCIKQLNGERTIYSIYHLLKGKKSSQTIQDAHLYELKPFFRIYHLLTRESLEEVITNALNNKWISPCEDQRYLITELGEQMLNLFIEKHPIPQYRE